jgi:predicted esterase
MGQDASFLKRDLAPLLNKPYVWLFPRGPYPLEVRGREMRLGYAWYMYDGDQARLRASMELTSGHLLALMDSVWNSFHLDLSRAAVLGFSQGGYMAGVLGALNFRRFKAACSIAGRLKHEFMAEVAPQACKRVKLAQVHGGRDESVKPDAARGAVEECVKLGFTAEYFEDPEAGHQVSPKMAAWVGDWLERVL